MNRAINLDTSDWGPFDPNSVTDQMCERERLAFTQYTLKRVKKKPQTGSDDAAIVIGGFISLVQVCFATHGNAPPDKAREALHEMLDFAWLQVASMATPAEEMN